MNKRDTQSLKCKICAREFSMLATHIIRTHDIKPKEYLKRFPGSKLTTDQYRKKQSASVRKRFIQDPELRKKVASRTFDFIKNDKLRSLLQRDYKTAKNCLNKKLWKPTIILYGSVIEAILIENTGTKNFESALSKALADEIVSKTEFHEIHVVRNSRNFVHLHKEVSEEGSGVINDYYSKTISEICEALIKRFRKS